jgi:hypothetical protein
LKDSTDAFTHVNVNHNETLPVFIRFTLYNETVRNFLGQINATHLSKETIDERFILPSKVSKESFILEDDSLEEFLGFNETNPRELFDRLDSIELVFHLQSYFLENHVPVFSSFFSSFSCVWSGKFQKVIPSLLPQKLRFFIDF